MTSTNPQNWRKLKESLKTQIRGLGRGQRILPIFVDPGQQPSGQRPGTHWAASGGTLGTMRRPERGHCVTIDTLSPSHSRDGMSLNRNYENLSVRSFSVITRTTHTRPGIVSLSQSNASIWWNYKWTDLMTKGITDQEWLLAWGTFSVRPFE